MHFVYSIFLHTLHFIYSLILRFRTFGKQRTTPNPPLPQESWRIPKHLAIVFVAQPDSDIEDVKSVLVESVLDAVEWCRIFGIKKLTVYEERDLLSHCIPSIRSSLSNFEQESECGKFEGIYQPPTPPPSDYSDSRPLSPTYSHSNLIPHTTIHVSEPTWKVDRNSKLLAHRHSHPQEKTSSKNDFLLCVLSREASKPAIAAVAQALGQNQRNRKRRNSRSQKDTQVRLTIEELDRMLEDEEGLSSPDFMIIHHLNASTRGPASLELHGFPPWHIRLTEIYHSQPQAHNRSEDPKELLPLDQATFREALGEYATAEMRFGK